MRLNWKSIRYPLKKIKAIVVTALIMLMAHIPLKTTSHGIDTSVFDKVKQQAEDSWVSAMYSSLTKDERIGQLIMVRAHSNKGSKHEAAVANLIKKYKVGGLTFFQGTPARQAQLTNRYQKLASKVPLMVSIDGEWGLGMRMKSSTISYPRQMTLGAIQDNSLIYDMGKEIGRQFRRLGIHVNFAPVVDVNNNPNNPVIYDRSFGEDRYNVTEKSYMYMKGMEDGRLMPCAKHFPGHGDTDVDSHHDLPMIPHPRYRLDSVELYPFKVLAQHNIPSVMIAHLNIPALDNTPNMPSSLSKRVISDLLVGEMGYEGLIFTDGLEMQGVRKNGRNGEVEVKALVAGNDILLLPPSTSATVAEIKKALANGTLSQYEFEKKVKKVLRYKYRLGLTSTPTVETRNLSSDLNSDYAKHLKEKLYENAITAVRNKNSALPFSRVNAPNIGTVSIGRGKRTTFQTKLGEYGKFSNYYTGREVSSSRANSLINSLKRKDYVIVSFHAMKKSPKSSFGISASARRFITKLQQHTKVIIVAFGSPYSLKYFDSVDHLIAAYEENSWTQKAVAKGIFGGIKMTGRLPVTASAKSPFGAGVNTGASNILQKSSPSSVGMNESKLRNIDRIAEEAIRLGATPGLQVLVAKDNKIVYQKAFGHHTYDKQLSTQTTDIFDMASVTKIAAATISVMKLVDEGKVDINQTLGKYIPKTRGTNKANLIIKEVMAHRARLQAWIPFYKETVVGTQYPTYQPNIYSKTKDETYSIPVADNMYMNKNYKQKVEQAILDSPLRSRVGYKYSDLGFYLMRDLVEAVSKKPFETYVQETFYRPLGLSHTGFNPLERFNKSQVVPTENDSYFRNQKVQGYVHDMGAAMLGGVSGHAGLFTTAEELAVIMQLLLNKGAYNGIEFFSPSSVKKFTTRHPKSTRRGIGFDMKQLNPRRSKNMSDRASDQTFGHMGFTGICAWADPKHNLVYLFLSNRTYPSMENKKLITGDYRPRIQTVIYEALGQ